MLKGTIKQLIPKMLNLPQDKEYQLEEYHEKRSLNANSYYYSLKNKICDKMNLDKEAQHFKYLKEFGQGYTIPLPTTQKIDGYVQYYEYKGKGKLDGIEVNYYSIYKPSHEMNSKEMWLLIKGVEQDAVALGIEILEEKKLRELLARLDKEIK